MNISILTFLLQSYTSIVALTQIKLPYGSRLLFAGTESGSMRAYKFPVSGNLMYNQLFQMMKIHVIYNTHCFTLTIEIALAFKSKSVQKLNTLVVKIKIQLQTLVSLFLSLIN